MNKNDQEFLVQKIRTQYTEEEHTQMDALKALDKKVKKPALIFGYTFGSLGAIVMGSGMSLVMTDLGKILGMEKVMASGIAIGTAGLLMVVANYPLYQKILKARRKKYADQVIALSSTLLNN